MKMKFLVEMVDSNEISPNELYLLWCLSKKMTPKNINVHTEIRKLRIKGLISGLSDITDEGKKIVASMSDVFSVTSKDIKKTESVSDDENIERYISLFPKGKLPSGKQARADKKNLKSNFIWFFKTYSYSWDIVLKATALYVDEYETKNFMYMRNSQYFISKMNPDRSRDSELANYCSLIVSGDYEENSNPFSEKVV